MAFEFKSLSFFFIFLLCVLLLLQISDDFHAEENTLSCCSSMKEISKRKLLVVNGLEAKNAVLKIDSKGKNEENKSWELRAAPLGPDPLHHHGADPKKPRTP